MKHYEMGTFQSCKETAKWMNKLAEKGYELVSATPWNAGGNYASIYYTAVMVKDDGTNPFTDTHKAFHDTEERCLVEGCDEPPYHSFVKSTDGGIVHLYD